MSPLHLSNVSKCVNKYSKPNISDITQKMIIPAVLLTTCIKLLLVPAYRSTDFEVHRNWLAITHSLPVNKWYYDDTSEWTLDYPPLFAWFEYLMSNIAKLFDEQMLFVTSLNYASFKTILFQRLSVIITDLVLAFGIYRCSLSLPKSWRRDIILPILVIANVGLFMVDHIHFQYNGVMFGILLLSISYVIKDNFIIGAVLFTLLINMKHIFIYVGPAYFIYMLRNYVFTNIIEKDKKATRMYFSIQNFFKLAFTVLGIFFLTFAPFYNQLPQVFSRMFPFKRGLCHAYWAPNVWAIYNFIDKIAAFLLNKIGFKLNKSVASMTGGLVQEFSHTALPTITPIMTMILIVIFAIPAMVKLWRSGSKPFNFIRCLIICALTSFMFGWHVHEKAILMAIIPLSILSVVEPGDAKTFLFLSIVGHYSLFPLLFAKELVFIKLLLFLIHSMYAFYSISQLYPFQFCKFTLPLLNMLETLYLFGLSLLFVYDNFIHDLLGFNKTLPFLPLLLTSVYCSLGVTYSYIRYYVYFLLRC